MSEQGDNLFVLERQKDELDLSISVLLVTHIHRASRLRAAEIDRAGGCRKGVLGAPQELAAHVRNEGLV